MAACARHRDSSGRIPTAPTCTPVSCSSERTTIHLAIIYAAFKVIQSLRSAVGAAHSYASTYTHLHNRIHTQWSSTLNRGSSQQGRTGGAGNGSGRGRRDNSGRRSGDWTRLAGLFGAAAAAQTNSQDNNQDSSSSAGQQQHYHGSGPASDGSVGVGAGLGPISAATARQLGAGLGSGAASLSSTLTSVAGPAFSALSATAAALGSAVTSGAQELGQRPMQPPSSPKTTFGSSSAAAPQLPSTSELQASLSKLAHSVSGMTNEELGVQLSFGGLAGFCSGYAVKKVGRAAAIIIGLGFIGVQVARLNGQIQDPDWQSVNAALVRALDTDGDGKITVLDLKNHLNKSIQVLGFGVPSGAAFAGAFVLGLKIG